MRADFLATEPHFADHLRPLWLGLSRDERGEFITRPAGYATDDRPGTDVAVVASAADMLRARKSGKMVVYMEHGCGISYRGTANPSYAGSPERPGVRLILSPNEYAARRSRAAHPGIPQAVVGCPKLDEWHRAPAKPRPQTPTVAVSFHWNCEVVHETRSALAHFLPALAELRAASEAGGYEVIGHGHPRMWRRMKELWGGLGIEPVESFAEVVARADVYCVDNSSTLYEFASLGRPVVVMNAPWYRRGVHHGLRFWEHSAVGVNADDPAGLAPAISLALADPQDAQERRLAATDAVYPVRGNATELALSAIREAANNG